MSGSSRGKKRTPGYATWGLSYSMAFRDLASEARNRAIADLANPALAKHPSRTGVTLTYSVHAAEAVVLSVVALESGINEIADWVRLGLSPLKPAHGLPPGFSDLSLADKWEAIPKAFVGRSFDKSAEPWQSFLTLGKLRDALWPAC